METREGREEREEREEREFLLLPLPYLYCHMTGTGVRVGEVGKERKEIRNGEWKGERERK